MRALSACLVAVLGLGVAVIAACSSTSSDDTAGGGSAGAATAGTSAGGTSAGTSSGGGTTVGAGGECSFESQTCNDCIQANCKTESTACGDDNACGASFLDLLPCVCGGTMSPAECETAFISGGDTQKNLATCFDTNCKSACEGATN
jgi:hypothetical protein